MADLDVIEPIPRLDPIVAIGKDELVEGGLEGAANRPIIALANQVAYILDRTYAKTDVDDIAANLQEMISAAEKGLIFYETQTELLAVNLGTESRAAQARDTRKIYLWKIKSAVGVTPVVWGWVDTGSSDLDLLKQQINSPELSFTTSISVDSKGTIEFPVFYAVKPGSLKKNESLFTFTPPDGARILYSLYYVFSTNSIIYSRADSLEQSNDICLIGVAYFGRFSSKYPVKYKGETNVIPKLSNEILNSVLNPALPIDTLYAYTNQSSSDFAPVVDVNNETLKSLGIRNAQKLEATGKKGGFGQANLFNRKLRSLKCAIGVIAYDESGVFDFGTNGAVLFYFQKLNSDGTARASFSSGKLTVYTELSEKVRLYKYANNQVLLSQEKYPDSYIADVLVGGRVGDDAPNPIYLSGYWFSYADDVKGYNYPISFTDTHYPNFLKCSDSSIYSYFSDKYLKNESALASINNKMDSLDSRVKILETAKPKKSVLQSLYDDLHNPFISLNIRLVGDSITWGSGASNRSATDPRTGRLTDPRNKTDPISPSWANLLRQWLCLTFTDGEIVHEGNGSAYSSSNNTIILSNNLDSIGFANPSRNLIFSNDKVKGFIKASNIESREYIDIIPPAYPALVPTEFSFYTNSKSFSLVFAKFGFGDSDSYFFNVYIDDVFYRKVSLYAPTASFDYEEFFDLPGGAFHKVTIKNESTVNNVLRVQNLKISKSIRVLNDGINGSSTNSWLNSVKLSESIKKSDNYVFVQLGTNDRIRSSNNTIATFTSNLKKIVDDIDSLSEGNAKTVLMSANAVTQSESVESAYYCTMKTINSVIKAVSDEKQVGFISNFEHTQQLKIDGVSYLADGLHPNDFGYRVIFENIRNHILIK